MLQALMDFCHFGEFGLDAKVFIFAPVAGLGWLLAYIDLIRLGIKQKTYGMPIAALALNIVWEGLYAYMYWAHDGMFYGGYMMACVNTAWFFADCAILYTHLKWGKKDFKKFANEKYFWSWFAAMMIMAFIVEITWLQAYGVRANGCTAIVQNLPMSILFIFLLYIRKSTEGQSMNIALGKMFGTIGAWLAIAVYPSLQDPLNIWVGVACTSFDLIYCVLLYKQFKAEGKNPWFPSRPADPAKVNLEKSPVFNPNTDEIVDGKIVTKVSSN